MAQDSERRYQATRVRAGDYVIPSNDGAQLWRITSYQEEGTRLEMRSATAGVLHLNPPTRTRWQARRYRLTVAQMHDRWGDDIPDDFLDWDQWEHWQDSYATKAAAIRDVVGR